MAGAWKPAPWSRWSAPWARTLKLAPGTFITPQLRLVRPCAGADPETVWVADHLALEIQVAVTFARTNAGSENGAPGSAPVDLAAVEAARFTRQAQFSARIGDPHVVQIFEHGVAKGGVPYIVTELLEGKGLRQRLMYGGPLSLAEAEAIVTQTAVALANAHAQQLTHGSLCPDNLFLIEAGGQTFVKIRNFCSVNAAELQASPNHAYLSPEQLLSSMSCSAQSDLWALAVTAYELLTTILPFEAPTTAGVTVAICNSQFSPPSHYRADLLADIDLWFARALAKEPLDRFRDARELAIGFSRAASAEALLVAPELAAPLSWQPRASRPGAALPLSQLSLGAGVPGASSS